MNLSKFLNITILVVSLTWSINGVSQETEDTNSENFEENIPKKGLRLGLYIGSYFANQYTASIYDGYGFDIDGKKNTWDNSLMNQKINKEYGGRGYPGQPDLIAQELNVNYQEWIFNASDMPLNMRYSPSFSIGLNCIYSVDVKNAILLNVNLAKLNIGGNFTIITPQQSGTSQINDRIKTFAIKGVEQRMMLQFGYQRIIDDNEKVNFFVEGGSPTYERVNIGINPRLKLQNAIGLRAYYNI
ncbi:MAG: hypothetical protein K8R85_02705 [Bacteroidetes bacterium]|nr:hypothetical protein [Bacteroidota bacterium]